MPGYKTVIELLADELANALDKNETLRQELERLALIVDSENAYTIRELLRDMDA